MKVVLKSLCVTLFFVQIFVLLQINDAMAWANCTSNVPAGKFCKTWDTRYDCRPGCYCTGSKTAIGTSIDVEKSCKNRTNADKLNASGIYFCPSGKTSNAGAKSASDCYNVNANSGGTGSSGGNTGGVTNTSGSLPCPAGCFCLNNGSVAADAINVIYGWAGSGYDIDQAYNRVKTICRMPAATFATGSQFVCNLTGWYEISGSVSTYLICDREKYNSIYNDGDNFTYFMDDFSEMYNGEFGIYGRKNNEVIYFPNSVFFDKMYQCPVSYPISEQGAKSVSDCFTYDINGNKVYYGSRQTIHCDAGKYLPANTSQCAQCNPSFGHVCPGGAFETSNQIQGLKVNCEPGQYLPANATQCDECDNNMYLCFGGIYEANSAVDQGRIQHNGYFAAGNTMFTTCNPGYYMPANMTQCTACTGDYVCKGGIFYTAVQYDTDRGAVLCAYGHADNTHTKCLPTSSQPSFMKDKVLQNNVALSAEVQLQSDADIDTAKKMISAGVSNQIPKQINKTQNITNSGTGQIRKSSSSHGMMRARM